MEYPHIVISSDLKAKVNEYAKSRQIKFSVAVSELVELGFKHLNDNQTVQTNLTLFEKILGNEKYITMILEQLYADMDFDGKNNPKNNIGLNKIKASFIRNKFDD